MPRARRTGQRSRARAREKVRRSVLRDGLRAPLVERLSRYVWPWREAWLARLVVLLAVLDYLSTYALLELSNKPYAYERGPLAHWALQANGFKGLLLIDILEVGTLYLLAIAARSLYSRFGFYGYARAAYVAMLAPYAVAAFFATTNNLVWTAL